MATVLLDKVSKRFPRHVWALRELSLEVRAGELLTVLGPSGCGKTTTLRLIAGLTMPTTGRVYIDGKDMLGVPPHRRGVDMVFQTPALYPHLRVRENLVFGVQGLYNTFGRWFRRPAADEVRRRVEPVVDLLEIGHLLDRQPAELSGGERQRIALGRALIR
jgi:multiple sugar transport system ATP-binding protein